MPRRPDSGHATRRGGLPTAGALAGLLTIVAPAAAAAGAASPPPTDLQELREMLERIEQDNRVMRQDIDALKAETDADWLSAARAEDVRGMVEDVLSDAGTRTSLQGNGLLAGWDGGFFLQDPDGRFRLQLDGQVQVRFVLNHLREPSLDRWRSGFENTRTKLTLSGWIIDPNIEYLIRTDPTRNEPGLVTGLFYLRDAWLRYRFDNAWSVRLGQFKLPFNREELVASQFQQAVERSLINETLNIGRSQGIELQWSAGDHAFSVATSDGSADEIGGTNPFGLVDATPRVNTAALNEDVEWALAMRYERLLAGEWSQFRDLTSPPGDPFGMLVGVGLQGNKTENNGEPGPNRDEADWFGATVDASVEWGGANLFGSVIYHHINNGSFGQFDIFGIVVQGGVYIAPRHELFARWEYGWYEEDVDSFVVGDLNVVTAGWNWYIDGHDVKLSVDAGLSLDELDRAWDADIAGWRADADGDEHQFVIRTQFQLLF
jgi:phosphate-selective porin OprO/OprP